MKFEIERSSDMEEFNKKRNQKDTKWIENILFPLTEILGIIEEVEKFIANLTRMDFFENKDGKMEDIQDCIIRLSASLDVIKEAEPELLKKYEHIPWEKYIKIGKAIDRGKWALVYSIAWRMVSKGLKEVKKTVSEILELNKEEKEDFFF